MRQFLQNATQLQLFKQVPSPPRGGGPVWTPDGDFCSSLTVSPEAVGMLGPRPKQKGLRVWGGGWVQRVVSHSVVQVTVNAQPVF